MCISVAPNACSKVQASSFKFHVWDCEVMCPLGLAADFDERIEWPLWGTAPQLRAKAQGVGRVGDRWAGSYQESQNTLLYWGSQDSKAVGPHGADYLVMGPGEVEMELRVTRARLRVAVILSVS
jgi:hypothetical protein